MRSTFAILTAALGLSIGALPLAAHHSFAAEYDAKQTLTLTGTVTKVEWMNPHTWFYLDVAGKDGKVVNWSCEGANPNALARRGWRKNSLKAGDKVIVEAYRAKDGSTTVNARTITLSDGHKIFAGSSDDGSPTDGTKGDTSRLN
jgi:hypothetical protein